MSKSHCDTCPPTIWSVHRAQSHWHCKCAPGSAFRWIEERSCASCGGTIPTPSERFINDTPHHDPPLAWCPRCADVERAIAFSRDSAPTRLFSEEERVLVDERAHVAGMLRIARMPDPGVGRMSETELRDVRRLIDRVDREATSAFNALAWGGDPRQGWSTGGG